MSSQKFVKKILPQPTPEKPTVAKAAKHNPNGVSFISEKARALSLRDQLAKVLDDTKQVEKAARILERWLHNAPSGVKAKR